MFEVAAHLRGLRQRAEVVIDRLYLQHAALGLELKERGFVGVLLEIFCGKETAIRQAGTAVCRMNKRDDLRLELAPDTIEQVGQRGVTGGLGSTRAADGVKVREVAFHWVHAEKDAQGASGAASPGVIFGRASSGRAGAAYEGLPRN